MFGSSLPLPISNQFGHSVFAQTTLGHNLPVHAAWVLTGAFCCLMIMVFIEGRIAPPRPDSWTVLRQALVYFQWLAVPVVGIVFSNLPALEAQTRLMTGRRLEYRVTEKV